MNNLVPPKFPFYVLRWFCKKDYVEEIEGDLLETYENRTISGKPTTIWLWFQIFKLIKPNLLKSVFKPKAHSPQKMLVHNLKVSFRSFNRYRSSFVINFIGLVGGLLSVFFIYLWVNHEFKVDRFHKNGEQIFRLANGGANPIVFLNTNPVYSLELASNIPEIEFVVNSAWGKLKSNLFNESIGFPLTGEFGSKKFFELFSYPLLLGDTASALTIPNGIVLSKSTALKIFNTTDVIGKSLMWNWFTAEEPLVVTGVFEDLPSYSSEQFDYVLSIEIFKKRFPERFSNGRNGRTFIKLIAGASPELVNQKIHDYTREAYPDYTGEPYFLVNFGDYYLNNEYRGVKAVGGRITLVKLFIAIGILILIIACANFMNLSTARASLRVKEIGVRKTLGAHRKSLILQYLTESTLIAFFAGLTSLILVYILFPKYQELLGISISVQISGQLVFSLVLILLLTGILAGAYPAFYLSGFDPLRVLKKSFNSQKNSQWFRKGLLVFQFAVSISLMVAVMVIYKQMHFIYNKDLGYNKSHIINFETKGMNREIQQSFLVEAKKISGVKGASGITHALFGAQRASQNISWEGKDPDQAVWFEYGSVDFDMLELLEIELLRGRFFSKEYGNERDKIVINEVTSELLGFQDPLGKYLVVNDEKLEIIGVVRDFHFESIHKTINPTFFRLNSGWSMKLAISLSPERLVQTLTEIENLYDRLNEGHPFEYSFHEQDRTENYSTESKIGVLVKYAAILAILISSLGLLGLVSFVTEKKSKEIGLRKILGANTKSILIIVLKDFTVPLIIASLIGLGASTWLATNWLTSFAYRVSLDWWIFAIALLIMFFITGVATASNLFRVLSNDPINSLKEE